MKKNLLSLFGLISCVGSLAGSHLLPSRIWKLSFVITFLLSVNVHAQIRIVADLDQSEPYERNFLALSDHISIGNRSFFVADHGPGQELWTSDGTEAGTVFLKHFSHIAEMEASGGVAFFSAVSDQYGTELWRSDGTIAGTTVLADIYPGGGSSSPLSLTDVNGTLYFSANNKTHGRELWKSDGTVGGTQLVYDVKPGTTSSGVSRITAFGNSLLFVANDGTTGYELWKSDGTHSGTSIVADIHPTGNSSPGEITVANGIAFFAAEAPLTNRQLYKTDGTSAGTALVKVIRPGNRNAMIAKMTAVNGVVFFEADDDVHGLELWKSDGSQNGTLLVKDITPPFAVKTDADHLADVNGRLFFTGNDDDYRELWVSDGTSAGTTTATDAGDIWFRNDPGFVEIDGDALFVAAEFMSYDVTLFRSNGNTTTIVKSKLAHCACETSTSELPPIPFPAFQSVNGEYYFFAGDQYWKTDGTESGTVRIKDLGIDGGISVYHMADLNGTILFSVDNTEAVTGLWKTNGTPETTLNVQEWSYVEGLVSQNGLAWFADGNTRYTPFRTDGTTEGTVQLSTSLIWAGQFTGAGGNVFFTAQGPEGHELYKSDGTSEGTLPVKDIFPGGQGSPQKLTNVNGTLFFSADAPGYGRELWKSDGTETGTVMVKDIVPGSAPTHMLNIISYQNNLFFEANDGIHGMELWRSNGTAEGTVMVSDIRTGDENAGDLGPMTTANGLLFFTGINQDGKVALWKSTNSTVTMLRDFELTSLYHVLFLGSTSNRLLFLVRVGADTELWRSDGTVTGTTRLRRFRDVDLFLTSGAVRDNILYFGLGGKVWRSDATTAGTYELPFIGYATKFTKSGPYVYFLGESSQYGSELFLIEEESGSSSARIASAEEYFSADRKISGYPNPFRSTLTLRVNGDENETFTVNVLNATGQQVSDDVSLAYNVDHELGSSWKDGLYFIQIRQGSMVTTKKVIKTMN